MDAPTTPLALVTGGSSGIGLELARQLGHRGFDLVIAAEGPLDDAVVDLRSTGAAVEGVHVDLGTRDGVEALLAGRDHVVAGSVTNHLQTVAGPCCPSGSPPPRTV